MDFVARRRSADRPSCVVQRERLLVFVLVSSILVLVSDTNSAATNHGLVGHEVPERPAHHKTPEAFLAADFSSGRPLRARACGALLTVLAENKSSWRWALTPRCPWPTPGKRVTRPGDLWLQGAIRPRRKSRRRLSRNAPRTSSGPSRKNTC